MGSYDAAVMTGFICRLCSELNRHVIHIYSDKGKDLMLAEKINMMPISVEPQDSLPKTICGTCIIQLDAQYQLIQNIRKNRKKILDQARRARLLNEQQQSSSAVIEETQTSEVSTETCGATSNSNSE